MLKTYFLMAVYGLKSVFCSCEREASQGFTNAGKFSKIERIGTLPSNIKENSGIEIDSSGDMYIHSDGGNPAKIYVLDSLLNLKDTINIASSQNIDWEGITFFDKKLLIGDVGNNQLQRNTLQIWNTDNNALNFQYPNNQRFDAEALTVIDDQIVIFTKSYENGSKAFGIDSIGNTRELDNYNFSLPITAADVSPEGHLLALLSYGKIFIFDLKKGENIFDHPRYCIKTRRKQTEALAFKDKNTLIFTNEQGDIFQLKINRFDI